MAVTLLRDGLLVEGRHVPVYSGSIHYWRLERDLWPLILDRAQALGFNMIETYIPWGIHEVRPGVFDWGGDDPRKDIEGFIALCVERGMTLIVRPGPLINAELTDFGFPEWVVADPAVQARTALDTPHLDAASGFHPPRPFPVPSYASDAFYRYVAGWLDAVCPIITRHLAPRGPIIAVQSDNETSYLFFDKAYATDYSADSIRLYQTFLARRYGAIDALNAKYAAAYPGFSAVEPPRDCAISSRADVPWLRDWLAYKEDQIRWCVARIADMLRERGVVGVPIFHDVAYQYQTPLDLNALEAEPSLDWVGMNLYRAKEDYAGATLRMRYLSGVTRLPFAPEFGCGIWSHHTNTPRPEEHEFITLASLMYGLKAINFYMLVERDRWQGCPITRHGDYRPEYADFYHRLSRFLAARPLWRYTRAPRAAALLNYDIGRYAAMTTTLAFAHADLLRLPEALGEMNPPLDLRWDPRPEADLHRGDTWLGAALRGLRQRSGDYDLADSHTPLERLRRYDLLCLPTTDFLDGDAQERLLAYAASGGVVVFGPGLPTLDADLLPCDTLAAVVRAPGSAPYGEGRLVWVDRARLPQALAELAPAAHWRSDVEELDLVTQRDGPHELLFVANPTERAVRATLRGRDPVSARCVWGQAEDWRASATPIATLAPYSVTIWEMTHD